MSDFDVVGIGENATDSVLTVPNYPNVGGKVPYSTERYSPGGQVATAMVACATLGLRAKYIGAIGDDERGRIQAESLRNSGINLDHLHRRANCPNQSAYIVIDQSTGERTVFWNRADCLRLTPAEITPEQITNARLLHIDGHDLPAVEHAARIAREHNIPVSLDIDANYPGHDRVLPYVDYLIASQDYFGTHAPVDALAAIQQKYGMRMAAMTLGAYGAIAYTEGRSYYSPAFEVNCVDTTGAGDVFHGAFCYSVLQKMPIAEALEFSNAMAALNCTGMGARGHVATPDEVRSLMNSGVARKAKAF